MKNYLVLFATLASALSVCCQTTDTTFLTISQESGPMGKQRFLDQYDYVFGVKQPTRLLLKLNLVPVLLPLGAFALDDEGINYGGILGDFDLNSKVELGVEWKVLPALSLQATGILPTRGSDYFKGRYRGVGVQTAARWYYDMPRRIRSGQSTNNVSGNYISGEYQNFAQRDIDRAPSTYFKQYKFQSISLRYGMQRRLFRYGFADISIGAGYQWASYQSENEFNNTDVTDQGLFLETRVAVGLALGSPRGTKSNMVLCDVLRCFQEDRHLWKLSLAKALQVNQAGLFTNPKVSYEQKLGNSSFSVETEAEVFLSTYPYFRDRLQVMKYGAGVNVQPRWYFLQKRRIAKGKSGNNLAGVYAGMMGAYRVTKRTSEVYGVDPESNFYLAPHLGVQHRLFRNGFINFKFGVLYDLAFSRRYGYADPSSFLSELQVGFVL